MFKNVKIRLKFLILIIPPMLGFLGMTIYAGATEAATLSEAKEVYYDDLKHMIELLITVDREKSVINGGALFCFLVAVLYNDARFCLHREG